MVLSREPREAILSLLAKTPELSAKMALREYVHYYSKVRPYLGRVLPVLFEQATTDLKDVVMRFNAMFDVDFNMFEHTQDNVDRIFQIIDARYKAAVGSEEGSDARICRPTKSRRRMKESVAAEYDAPGLGMLRQKADALFEEVSARARAQPCCSGRK